MKASLVKTIEERFNAQFAQYGIYLPHEDIAGRQRGKIVKGGWAIWYLFGIDKMGEYLDYYASHRMTSDRHLRLYANGKEKELPIIILIRLCSDDPAEDAKLEARFRARNRRVNRLLKKKGFGIAGDEPGGVLLNRLLVTN
jgi:hypothetical protein